MVEIVYRTFRIGPLFSGPPNEGITHTRSMSLRSLVSATTLGDPMEGHVAPGRKVETGHE